MKTTTWGIVMTVNEPEALVLSNIAWHLSTGASEVHVYFDDPNDPVFDAVHTIPGVYAHLCSWQYWKSVRHQKLARPPIHRARQVINANHALAHTNCAWLIHIDADEFIYQTGDLAAELAVVSEFGCEIHFPVWERIHNAPEKSIFDGAFRTSTQGNNSGIAVHVILKSLYGDIAPFFFRGVLGHAAGKCGVRVGEGNKLNIHWTSREGVVGHSPRWKSGSSRLLHFDGLTAEHWLSKLTMKSRYKKEEAAYPAHRQAQMAAVRTCGDDPMALERLYDRLKHPSAETQHTLRAIGLLDDIVFDPSPGLRRLFGKGLDLSPKAFNVALKDRSASRLSIKE